jgi:hypothetical protein
VINEWTGNRDIPAFLKYGGTWESSGVPNIELAMMQLIHSRKALETDPIAYMQELQEFHYSGRGVSKDPTYSTKIKLPSSLTKLKTMVKKPGWKGLEYTMLLIWNNYR